MSSPQKETPYPVTVTSHAPSPRPWQSRISFLSLWICWFQSCGAGKQPLKFNQLVSLCQNWDFSIWSRDWAVNSNSIRNACGLPPPYVPTCSSTPPTPGLPQSSRNVPCSFHPHWLGKMWIEIPGERRGQEAKEVTVRWGRQAHPRNLQSWPGGSGWGRPRPTDTSSATIWIRVDTGALGRDRVVLARPPAEVRAKSPGALEALFF